MVSLEQIRLLETKIVKAIDFVTRLTEECSRLKKRNAELEGITAILREEKAKMEEGIVSALGRLDQFEDAINTSIQAAKEAGQTPLRQPPEQGAPAAPYAGGLQPRTGTVPPPIHAPLGAPADMPETSIPSQNARETHPAARLEPLPGENSALPSAYTVDEEPAMLPAEENAVNDSEGDPDKPELDIF